MKSSKIEELEDIIYNLEKYVGDDLRVKQARLALRLFINTEKVRKGIKL